MSDAPAAVILGITGASGAIYARRLLEVLVKARCRVHAVASAVGRQVACHELEVGELSTATLLGGECDLVNWYDDADLFATIASGSTPVDAMAICPASSHTVASLAAGLGDTLLRRAAYVTLKQRRPLVVVHREMPLTGIDLENLARLGRAGAIICPAAPGFYHRPRTLDDLVDSVVGRVAELMGVPHQLGVQWQP